MGIKLHEFGKGQRGGTVYCFHCPGCENAHPIEVPHWTWNGSMTEPTFDPSLLCNKDTPESRCHSFIRDGKIQFLSDCHHALKDTTVEIPDWE